MSIDPAQPIPIYFQLKTLLLEEILGGRYGPEDRLPTEHELCEQYGISRTPVTRALSELAEEGIILRHRRRGSFVNPHWLSSRPDQPEVRVVVPAEGPWAGMIRDAAGDNNQVSILEVPRESLHQMLTHAVAEGVAPDLAVIDSVWTPEFAAAGFLHALEDLDEDWIRDEHEVDFLEPLAASNRYGGRTFGIPPFADVAGLWYRRRELATRGLEPPGTWAELRSVARAIADRKMPHPIVMPGGSKGGETTAYCLIAFLASNSASVLQPEGVSLGSRATAQALRFLRSLVEADVMTTDVVALDWNRPIRLLAEGSAAISFGGTYEAQALGESLGRSAPRALAGLRLHGGTRRPSRDTCERGRGDDLHRVPPGRAAGDGDAAAPAGGRLGGARTDGARRPAGSLRADRPCRSCPRSCLSSRRPPRSSSAPCPDPGCPRTRASRCSCRRCWRPSSRAACPPAAAQLARPT